MSRVQVPATVRRGLTWLLAGHLVPHEVPLEVPQVVRHFGWPTPPPALGIRQPSDPDYPPSTRSFG